MGNRRIYLGRETGKYVKIAGGAIITVTSLFFVLMVLGFEITGTDDFCLGTTEDPCVSYGKICNLGPNNYDIYNPDGIKMDFSPTIENYWIFFKDGRVKKEFLIPQGIDHSTAGWRYENFTNATKPRKDRIYVHRFARYSCQDYMLVGLKNNPDEIIKWGFGVGKEYLDPFWYGENESAATISVSGNISLELGSKINITTNLTGAATTCVDIDHPDYGDNYTCGTPNANFLFNISYFRKTEFNDSSTVQTISPPYTLNNTGNIGSYGTKTMFESCANMSLNNSGTLRITIYIGESTWNVSTTNAPRIRIRNTDMELLEEIIAGDDGSVWDEVFYTDNIFIKGDYGICLVKDEVTSINTYFNDGGYVSGITPWPHYELNVTTGELKSNTFTYPPRLLIQSSSKTVYVATHSVDEVINLSVNFTGINTAENVKIFINNTETNDLGFVYNTSEGSVSETDETEFNLVSGNSTTFRIPKGATVTNTTMNFTGGNITWEIGEYYIPINAYGVLGSPAFGTPSWGGNNPTYFLSKAYDGNIYTGTYTWLDPLYAISYISYIYENYTKSIGALIGNWTTKFSAANTALNFKVDCWGGSWVNIVDEINVADTKIITLPDTCLSQVIIQFRNTMEYDGPYSITYDEGKINYFRYGYPENLTIEVGIVDGAYEFEGYGELTGSNLTTDFVAEINTYLYTCTADENDYCDVPIYFSSDDGGNLTIDNFEVLYTYNPNPIIIDYSVIQNYLNNSDGETDIPIIISMTTGSLSVSSLQYDYRGGNDTIEIFSWESTSMMGELVDTFNDSLSSFNISYGDTIKYLDFFTEANTTFLYINFTGYNTSGICTQPTANISTICGGKSTGTYGFSAGWTRSHTTLYDDDWDTYNQRTGSPVPTFYINYSKPDGFIGVKYWEVKDNQARANITIDQACQDQDPIQLSVTSATTSANHWKCWNGTAWPIQRTSGAFYVQVYEETIHWNLTNYPKNLTLKIGDVNGTYDWEEDGSITAVGNQTTNLESNLDSIISDCDCDGCTKSFYNHYCQVPFNFYHENIGMLEIHNINITYNIPINFSNNDTLDLIVYYSNWDYIFPTFVEWLEFIPKSATTKNVTPHGQTSLRPIFNITNYGYGGMNSNFSIYLNESYSCVNLTMSTTDNKSAGFLLNAIWRDYFTNFSYGGSQGLWMWADYGCNYTTWKLWEPNLLFRNCCEDCICSEDLE